jgi:hypothetical protein
LQHIDDSTLELYALRRLSEFEVMAIQEHLLICTVGQTHYEETLEFASVMRAATQQMVTELIATHHTNDGPIHLYVRPIGPEAWVCTIRGTSTSGGRSAATRQEAIDRCINDFRAMFPEHVCSRACIGA